MKKIITLFLLFNISALSNASNNSCIIKPIPNKFIEYGCSCNYYKKNTNEFVPYFQSEIDFTNPKMYINNKLVNVNPIKVNSIPVNKKIGSKFSQSFEFMGNIIHFENIVTFVCPPNSESCEVTEFETIMKTKNKQCNFKEVTIKGSCGC